MMTFRKISAACKGRLVTAYYTQDIPDPEIDFRLDPTKAPDGDGARLTSYYTGRDGRAAWRPDLSARAADVLGIDRFSPPTNEQLANLYEAKRADNGEAWSAHGRKISAYDLTLAPHKSVTLAAEFATTEAERAAIWHAIDTANDATMRYVARELGQARRGRGGKDGAEEGEVAWVSYRHTTARPTVEAKDPETDVTYLIDTPVGGDPHAHIHNTLFNMVVTEDGHVGSLDTKQLRSRVHEFGAYFQAVLAQELRSLGIEQQYDANEQATIVSAVPQPISDFFSKGRRNVLKAAQAYATDQGLDWDEMSIEGKQKILSMAGLAARLGKDQGADDREIWKRQADELGWVDQSLIGPEIDPGLDRHGRLDEAWRFVARHLEEEFKTAAVIDHHKLRMYAARGLIATGIEGGIKDIDDVVALTEERGIEVRGQKVQLVISMNGDHERVTHTEQIRIEEDLTVHVARAAEDRRGALGREAIDRAIERSGLDFESAHGLAQREAVYTLGQGGAIAKLTGVAGSGKTTLLRPLVDAWRHDERAGAEGRRVIGVANAWRQAHELEGAGIEETYALSPFLDRADRGDLVLDRNTVIVVDEVGQVAPRQMLRLLEMQRDTGLTLRLMGDREQAQSIEAGDALEIIDRVLNDTDSAELLSAVRQRRQRDRTIAGLFRGEEPGPDDLDAWATKGKAKAAETDAERDDDLRNRFHTDEVKKAIAMKREDGTISLVTGDHANVLETIARHYLDRRDALRAEGPKQDGSYKTVSMSVLTNRDAADLSLAVRKLLQERGDVSRDERIVKAVDQRGEEYDLALAAGDRVRLYKRVWGTVDGQSTWAGNNGDICEVVATTDDGVRLRLRDGREADVQWRRLSDGRSNRVMLGFGHAMTVDAAQGITSDEHINAMPRGVDLATGFTSYVAESRARGSTWTMIADGATFEAVRNGRALGDQTPITSDDLWNYVARKMAHKPYKALGMDLPHRKRQDRDKRVRELIDVGRKIEQARRDGRDPGQENRIAVRGRQLQKEHGGLIARLDNELRQIMERAPVVMSERELSLRREWAGATPPHGEQPVQCERKNGQRAFRTGFLQV
ncbi:relaxase domain-containing protein [Acetobacter sacchari]|uniref:Relaxase domain-containing protein n=1 Tax=Acetobacter sacchari TaxID=2661687 RepID=A0ABS3LWN0_9PROT|nr:MobF family relaxase [Acetobacter sacchari]MBO1360326.1 relaxase domain-containing protein [Acetobacter sacchari]